MITKEISMAMEQFIKRGFKVRNDTEMGCDATVVFLSDKHSLIVYKHDEYGFSSYGSKFDDITVIVCGLPDDEFEISISQTDFTFKNMMSRLGEVLESHRDDARESLLNWENAVKSINDAGIKQR